jgi:hypothetical protein
VSEYVPAEKLVEAVHFYRGLGFFSQYSDLPDTEAAKRLNAIYRSDALRKQDLDMSGDLDNLVLLSLDEDRVWWEDAEANMIDGDNFYVAMTQTLGRISRGAFQPQQVDERWEGEEITVSFDCDGQSHEVKLDESLGWIDPALIDYVSRLMEPAGYKLEALCTADQTIALVALSSKEKELLERDRPILFAWDELY